MATLPDWRPRLHLTPQRGWMNDPNGLSQLNGTYHFFFQYAPGWPEDDTKWWGHATSTDLLSWTPSEPALEPSCPQDEDGVYSGCAVPLEGPDRLRAYYTGVRVPEDARPHSQHEHDACQLVVESAGGVHFGQKRVLLAPEDYPQEVCSHVRDPKVWRDREGVWWMLLGTRTREDLGEVMVWRSEDGLSWGLDHFVRPDHRLGYMWECPNLAQLDGHDFLAVCPQGLPSEDLRWQNRWQAGYLPLQRGIYQTQEVDAEAFVEWDHGFDFYAPQIFEDESGRIILVGWMGTFDHVYSAAPEGLTWCHSLTLPRQLTLAADGRILQWPVAELDARRHDPQVLAAGQAYVQEGLVADLTLQGIEGQGSLALGTREEGEILSLTLADGLLSLAFSESEVAQAAALGRTHRTIPCEGLSDLRLVVDGSTVEVYANGGAVVFSTRWFPQGGELTLRSGFVAQGTVWQLA